MKSIKKSCKILFTVLVAFAVVLPAWTETLTGEQIMQKVDAREQPKTSKQTTTMKLIDKRGHERVRSVVGYAKDYGDVEKSVMIFKKPADVKGVGFLSYSYEEIGKDDDSWLFLPALGKSRRISGSSQNDDFMGTDFTYDDMGGRKVAEDTHTFIKEETVDGNLCWVVESVPKEKGSLYSKKIAWIRQDVLIPVKVEYYDKKGKLLKVLNNSGITQISGLWTIQKMEMKNVQKKHTTIITFDNTEFNVSVNDSYFTVASLERGRIR